MRPRGWPVAWISRVGPWLQGTLFVWTVGSGFWWFGWPWWRVVMLAGQAILFVVSVRLFVSAHQWPTCYRCGHSKPLRHETADPLAVDLLRDLAHDGRTDELVPTIIRCTVDGCDCVFVDELYPPGRYLPPSFDPDDWKRPKRFPPI